MCRVVLGARKQKRKSIVNGREKEKVKGKQEKTKNSFMCNISSMRFATLFNMYVHTYVHTHIYTVYIIFNTYYYLIIRVIKIYNSKCEIYDLMLCKITYKYIFNLWCKKFRSVCRNALYIYLSYFYSFIFHHFCSSGRKLDYVRAERLQLPRETVMAHPSIHSFQ